MKTMKSLEVAAENLYHIRKRIEALNKKAQLLRQLIVEEIGAGRQVVLGEFLVTTERVETVPYLKVLREIERRHPHISSEINELMEQFKTPTVRVIIDKVR